MHVPQHELDAMLTEHIATRNALERLHYAVAPLKPADRLTDAEDRELYQAFLESGRVMAAYPKPVRH